MKTLVKSNHQINPKDLEQKVKKMYRDVALHPEVTYHFAMGRMLAERLGYPTDLLDEIPADAINSFAGVGYYFDLLELKKGDHVADLGSGSGMDVFFAANQIGTEGKVLGIDMTDEQLEKARSLSDRYDYSQVLFQKGYIEALPISSASLDAVISNGVINLSADKSGVFKEASRVLKPGGRLALADIVSTDRLPENISGNSTLWAACIGGAMQEAEYYSRIEDAGLKIVKTRRNPYRFLSKSAAGATRTYGIKSISLIAVKI